MVLESQFEMRPWWRVAKVCCLCGESVVVVRVKQIGGKEVKCLGFHSRAIKFHQVRDKQREEQGTNIAVICDGYTLCVIFVAGGLI